NLGEYGKELETILDRFSDEHGYLLDDAIVQKTGKVLEVLSEKAIVPYVRRSIFEELGLQRNRTKTPPGFRDKDDNNGDYYIWVDLLRGLQTARSDRRRFSKVIFVTEDKKDDWSRNGTPHPILSAEIKALFD